MMPLEKQVCSLEPAKRLKELGVPQESHFFWIDNQICTHYALKWPKQKERAISAFTVSELGEILGIGRRTWKTKKEWLSHDSESGKLKTAETEADARALMLCYLIEKGIVKP